MQWRSRRRSGPGSGSVKQYYIRSKLLHAARSGTLMWVGGFSNGVLDVFFTV